MNGILIYLSIGMVLSMMTVCEILEYAENNEAYIDSDSLILPSAIVLFFWPGVVILILACFILDYLDYE